MPTPSHPPTTYTPTHTQILTPTTHPHTRIHTHPHTHTCIASPNYTLSNFLIESAPLRKQLEQETCRYEYEDQSSLSTILPPTKHQLVSCLATRGQWVTRQHNLQLDPPESQLLLMKGASLHFLFESGWALSGAHQGDYLLMLKNIVSRIEDGTLKYVRNGPSINRL